MKMDIEIENDCYVGNWIFINIIAWLVKFWGHLWVFCGWMTMLGRYPKVFVLYAINLAIFWHPINSNMRSSY